VKALAVLLGHVLIVGRRSNQGAPGGIEQHELQKPNRGGDLGIRQRFNEFVRPMFLCVSVHSSPLALNPGSGPVEPGALRQAIEQDR
jgi:hypothetical protein